MVVGRMFWMNMYEAIFVRKSVKKFLMEELEQPLLEQIVQFARELPLLMENAEIEFTVLENVNNEIKNPKLLTVKAPYYFVVACENKPDQLLNAGFLMEQMILFIASRGIGTGVLSHVRAKAAKIDGIEKNPVLILAFGDTKEIMYHDSRKVHRLPENEVVVYKTDVKADVKLMVKAARLAPSYLNSQPWRLVVYDNRIHVFCKKNVLINELMQEKKYLDVGVMIANLLLVAEELWIDVQIEKLSNISAKLFKNNDYIFSVIVK